MDRRVSEEWMRRMLVVSVSACAVLERDQVMAGWEHGFKGMPEPDTRSTTAFWHGWRGGRVDGGWDEPDPALATIVAEHKARRRRRA